MFPNGTPLRTCAQRCLSGWLDVWFCVVQKAGLYQGKKFNGITYFFGYQARGSLPSNFDCCYAYVSPLPPSLSIHSV